MEQNTPNGTSLLAPMIGIPANDKMPGHWWCFHLKSLDEAIVPLEKGTDFSFPWVRLSYETDNGAIQHLQLIWKVQTKSQQQAGMMLFMSYLSTSQGTECSCLEMQTGPAQDCDAPKALSNIKSSEDIPIKQNYCSH